MCTEDAGFGGVATVSHRRRHVIFWVFGSLAVFWGMGCLEVVGRYDNVGKSFGGGGLSVAVVLIQF